MTKRQKMVNLVNRKVAIWTEQYVTKKKPVKNLILTGIFFQIFKPKTENSSFESTD
jgi:hypothetical protein